jgi:Type IV secretion-system coupling protein DNA-binding domain
MNELTHWLLHNGLRLSAGQRTTHTYIIGQPGAGKSRAIESWAMQDIANGQGVCVVDTEGDLYHNLVSHVAVLAERQPELTRRVILLDPTDPKWTVGFNPLEPIPGIAQERLVGFITDWIIKLWKIDPTTSPRMLDLLSNTLLAQSDLRQTLVDSPRFLRDHAWRNSLLKRVRHRSVLDYFKYEFPENPSGAKTWIAPILNKIKRLVFDPDVRLMLGARSTLNFRQIMDRKLVVLVNLSKGVLGEGNSAMLGAFIVAQLQQAALSRVTTRFRPPFYVYLDEFQNYTTDNIKEILAGARKYSLSITLAHQYLGQLSDDLRQAVLNTTGTLACFRVGYHDAGILAKEIFPPRFLRETDSALQFTRLAGFSLPNWHHESEPLRNDQVISQLTQLQAREFWTKRRSTRVPLKQRTLDMPDLPESSALREARARLIETAGQQYGTLKNDVRRALDHERIERDEEPNYYEEG